MRDSTRARAVLAILLLASATLILLDLRGSSAVGGVRAIAGTIIGPVERAVAAAVAPAVAVGQSITSFGDSDVRRQQAAAALADLQRSPLLGQDLALQAEQLEALMGVAGISGASIVPSRVVAYGTAQTFSGTVTIDSGTIDGVAADMSVITGAGLVGRVIEAFPTTATVQLISDDDSVVGARLAGTREAGAVEGIGDMGELVMTPLDPAVLMAVGEWVVSFGSPDGRPYMAGLPIGFIVGFRGEPGQADRVALIEPAARLSALDIVGVVVRPARTDPRDALVPAAPPAEGTPEGATPPAEPSS